MIILNKFYLKAHKDNNIICYDCLHLPTLQIS